MNRNSENHFGVVPTVDIPRSVFLMKKPIRTTFDSGLLVPFYCNQDVMPGETYTFDFTGVIRQSTPITPTMDQAVADIFCFFQRNFNLWDHWKEFWGENPNGMWTDNAVEYTIPQIEFFNSEDTYGAEKDNDTVAIKVGDIADYMGLPLFNPVGYNSSTQTQKKISVSALPFRMNIQVWNNFFRNQNVEAPYPDYRGDSDSHVLSNEDRTHNSWTEITNGTSEFINNVKGTPYIYMDPRPAPVNKMSDYFTTCAIQPQRGNPVTLPLGTSAPVLTNDKATFINTVDQGSSPATYGYGQLVRNTLNNDVAQAYNAAAEEGKTTNLYADLTNAVASTVNALRLSFATQRILERDIYGTRYFESIKNFFHVTSPFAVQTVPEYIGGFRIGIDQTQVAQTSSSTNATPQGTTAAYSLTTTNKRLFTKSFTEHGILIFYIVVRNRNSYDQGIERQWSRTRRLHYYHPQLAHLGYQEVKSKEIFADGTADDEGTWGYQEHWAELKYERPMNTGLFHTTATGTLAYWHYGDSYATRPTLSIDWSISTKENIARTLAVQNEPQYIMDSLLTIRKASPIPAWSTPGLLDHY